MFKKVKEKVKELFHSKTARVALMTSAVAAIATVAASADATTPPSISSTMTTSIQSVVTDTLSCIAAVAPIAITIFGAVFAWKMGVKFFKQLAH